MNPLALTFSALQGPAHLLHLGVLQPIPDAAHLRAAGARAGLPDQGDLSAPYGCHLRSPGHMLVWGGRQAEEQHPAAGYR